MNKYAKKYISSFTGVINQKFAVELNVESMGRGLNAVNNFGWGVYDALKKPFIDSWQNVQDAKYYDSIGDHSAANAKRWSAAGNAALGTTYALPVAGLASRTVMGGRAAIPAATSFIPKAWNSVKGILGPSGLYAGQKFLEARGNKKLLKSDIGPFELAARQNYEKSRGSIDLLTKPSPSSRQLIETALKPWNEALPANPTSQGIASKVMSLPTKERIEKSLPYERTLHEIQAMMSQ